MKRALYILSCPQFTFTCSSICERCLFHICVARVTATPRGYIIWASPIPSYIDNTTTFLRYTTSPLNNMPVSPPLTSLTPRTPPSGSSGLLFPISPTAVPYAYPVIWRRTFIPTDKIYRVLCPSSSLSPFISSKLVICIL